ncbi:TlpA family protein disulfide reductase [Paludifilum halophilum]|uniref:TlpA family protein disulfide reductase n=1 Tax=Paludifilum halophilum TaxID=1642702 RepID=UPI00146AB58A|nr:TlpA disulfide reductase family protein [Paludifilum halophilum]
MGDKKTFWRNLLVSAVIVAAVAGAVITGLGKENAKEQSTSPDAKTAATSDSEQGGSDREGDESNQPTGGEAKPAEGFEAPDFTLKTLDGKTVTLSDNDGKPSIINVWASWCPPCKKEMPLLQKAYKKYGDQVNFHMVNLTIQDNKEKMESYLEEKEFTFPVLLDETGEIVESYGVVGIPQTYAVDEKGKVIRHIQGEMSEKQLEELMKELTS